MNEINLILGKAKQVDDGLPISKMIVESVAACRTYMKEAPFKDFGLGLLLASIFDLAVTATYAQKVGNNGWIFCRHNSKNEVEPILLYPFVNACPRCSASNKFVFTPSKKPESAVIGRVSSVILGSLLDEIVKANSKGRCRVSLLNGNGVVDAIIQEGNKICFLEIKASPLVTFPLAVETDDLLESEAEGVKKSSNHKAVTATTLTKNQMHVYFPQTNKLIPIGTRKNTETWPYDVLSKFVQNRKQFLLYVTAWKDVYDRYCGIKPRNESYWLANGCGQPVPRSSDWPARRVGSGYESISDSKSSVGMDRTDDIKKGIYQVLKIGTRYKEFVSGEEYEIRTALISNMHAVRHHDEYLKEFEDLVWTIDSSERPYRIEKDTRFWHVPVEGVHNLYDALFAFTSSHIRDPWLKSRLSLH